MLFWITIFLAYGFIALELFLLLTRKGKMVAKPRDRGTLRLVLILIGGSCFAGFFLARRIQALNWPENIAIVYLADILLGSGIALRISSGTTPRSSPITTHALRELSSARAVSKWWSG